MRPLLLAILLTSPALASGDLAAHLGALNADDLATRDAATAELLADESVTLADIEAELPSPELSPEQRTRLETIGRERFAEVPKAGLGVRFGDSRFTEGVALAGVVDGFPAAEYLKPGDVVISIDNQPVSLDAHMGAIILSHLPGETLRIEIDRPRPAAGLAENPPPGAMAEPVFDRHVFDVPLGNYKDLETGIELSPARLESAYRQRLARKQAETPAIPLIGGGLSPLEWLEAEGYDEETDVAPGRSLEHVAAWRYVSFGGQPRSSIDPVELRRGDTNAVRLRANRALQADGEYDRLEEALAGYRAMAHRLEEVRAELDRLVNAPPNEELTFTRRLRSLRDESLRIEQSLDEIRELFRAMPSMLRD